VVYLINLEELKKQMFFIFYAPGTFGSFLHHVLILSDKFTNYFDETLDIFDQYNRAHNNMIDIIHNFHSDDDLKFWQNLKTDEKYEYLNKNIEYKLRNENLFQPPQRVATFIGINEIRNFFPISKKIFILYDKNSIDILSKIMPEKITSVNEENAIPSYQKISKLSKNIKMKSLILSHNSKKITQYYYDISKSIDINDDDAIFYFENFFSYNSFLQNLEQVLDKFDIQLDIKKVETLYKKFYNVNIKYFENK